MKNNVSDAVLKSIFDTVVDGVIVINERGIILLVNPATALLFGYAVEELEGKNVKMLMPPFHQTKHDQYLANYMETGVAQIIGIGREVQGRRRDGGLFPFVLSISEIKTGEERLFAGIIHDISDLKTTRQALVESEYRLDAIFRTAVDGIIVISQEGLIELVNPSLCKMFGYEAGDLLGKNVSILMPEPDKQQHDYYMSRYHQTGKGKIIGIGREVKGQRKNGNIFPFNLSISEVKMGNRVVYTGVIHDISEQKRIQNHIEQLNTELEKRVEQRTEQLASVVNRLLKANKDLEREVEERKTAEDALRKSRRELESALEREQELNKLKSRFVSTASHEFRTPLSTILSSASLIAKYNAPNTEEKRKKHIDRIKSAVQNLTGILNDFLSISKLEDGKVQQHPKTFDIQDFSCEVMEEMQAVTQKGQEIVYKFEGKSPIVYLDRLFLKNIVINLLSNAIKYSYPDTEIHYNISISEEQLAIEVRDFGIGIPDDEKVHIFEQFFRAKNAFNLQGTGLGLNIVKRYVDMMKGTIRFESEINKGTIFFVKIPLQVIV